VIACDGQRGQAVLSLFGAHRFNLQFLKRQIKRLFCDTPATTGQAGSVFVRPQASLCLLRGLGRMRPPGVGGAPPRTCGTRAARRVFLSQEASRNRNGSSD
jgi:hypothetical protein